MSHHATPPPLSSGDTARLQSTQHTADRLHSAAIHLLRRVRDVDQELGLSAARLSSLSYLVFAGPASVSELARMEQVTPASISQLVNGMERDGLVERLEDPGDGRGTLVVATAEGEKVMQQGREARVRRLLSLLGELDERDLQTLDKAAEIIEGKVG